MIYIFSAFYAEAKNIIDHYGLKKEKSPEMVRFDVFANDSIRLVITGVGEINAAAAVSNIGGAYGISQDDEILNVGCGAGFSSDICMGSIFLGNKLTEQMTGRTFYPDMLMKANFRECEIVTVARVLNEGSDSVVYDMEAAAVYQAAAFFGFLLSLVSTEALGVPYLAPHPFPQQPLSEDGVLRRNYRQLSRHGFNIWQKRERGKRQS